MKTTRSSMLIMLSLVCFALLPKTQAVVPPPDGAYPGFNTAEGQNALFSLTTGSANTAVGWFSLKSVTTGSFNSGVGAGTLVLNTGDSNTATGAAALLLNTTGQRNTANGTAALVNNSTGSGNTADGAFALSNNTVGGFNTATGIAALQNNTEGDNNTAIGLEALSSNSTGNSNTAIGDSALFFNISGSGNTALGVGAGTGVTTADNVICIDTSAANVPNSCFIGNIRGVTTANANAIPVLIDSSGQLGTMSSSRQYKKEIKAMDKTSEAILALKPVTFHYKSDSTNRPEFGLIAEEVAEINPDLVVRDENGEIYTVRYDAVNAMLLNEFLKEHRKNEQQEATIAQLKKALQANAAQHQKQIDALTAGLQKVSAQLELSKATPATVLNNQ